MSEFGPEDMVTITQASTLVSYHRRTIMAWIQNGWLDAVRGPGPRGRYKVRYRDLMEVANRPYRPKGDISGES